MEELQNKEKTGILFVPIDNRPVTYLLTKEIAAINKNLKLYLPSRGLTGGLHNGADFTGILNWLKSAPKASLIVLSLDTIAYGGLISSRREAFEHKEIKERLLKLKTILETRKNEGAKILAFSSIMRVSNNNINEEEKEYWNVWGEKIFSYSYNWDKKRRKNETFENKEIPNEILEDYLETRKRNFEVNKIYLDWLKENILDFLIYSKDDTGEFGLNVYEAELLQKEIEENKLNAIIKTGADEIPLGLLLRGVVDKTRIKFNVVFNEPKGIDKISRYEDISVKKCVYEQIKLGVENALFTDKNPDITIFVNNFEKNQGDLVFRDIINEFKGKMPDFAASYIIADINNANGADNKLISEILNKGYNKNFLSYSGWNTSANTLGSAIASGVINFLSKDKKDEAAFKKFLFVRFLDDWAYQNNLRYEIQTSTNKEEALKLQVQKFKPYENEINKFLGTNFIAKYSLPWKRSFEIEITIL